MMRIIRSIKKKNPTPSNHSSVVVAITLIINCSCTKVLSRLKRLSQEERNRQAARMVNGMHKSPAGIIKMANDLSLP